MKSDNLPTIRYLLQSEGYYNLRHIDGRGICGLMRFAFTVGLCYGLDESGYEGRYCFENNAHAIAAINNWNGIGDPDTEDWIKHKGGMEYSNPLRAQRTDYIKSSENKK